MKHIPNLITCLNLFAGCMACVMALHYNSYLGAFYFICLAALFDFLDGFAARLLKAYSNIGAELDSLADVISFGLAPACILYTYLVGISEHTILSQTLPLLSFLLPVFSAVRLAKFNVDTRQTSSFLGLPVPASGLFWAATVASLHEYGHLFDTSMQMVVLVIVLIVFCLLMVSELPMFSLKFKNVKWKGNEWPFSFLILSIILIGVLSPLYTIFTGVSAVIILYILMSIIKHLTNGKK